MISTIKEVYQYRDMIYGLVTRNLKGRYKNSVLGFLWTFLIPLLQLVVYTIVFSFLLKSGYENYYIFLFVALVPWIFFSSSLTEGASCIVAQQNMVNKIYFPREVLPIAQVLYLFVNMLLSYIVVFLVVIISGYGINFQAVLYYPIVALVECLLCMGMAMLFSALDVYFRDIEMILGIIAMLWQFLTPVMYGIDIVPEKMRFVFMLNPMSAIIIAYREIFYYKQVPELSNLLLAVIMGFVFLVFGTLIFGKLKKGFSEEM